MTERRKRGSIVFMAVWLTFWIAGMLVVTWLVSASVLRGDYSAAPFLLVWLAAAGLGLHAGLRKMQTVLGLARPEPPRPAVKPRAWRDGMPERGDG